MNFLRSIFRNRPSSESAKPEVENARYMDLVRKNYNLNFEGIGWSYSGYVARDPNRIEDLKDPEFLLSFINTIKENGNEYVCMVDGARPMLVGRINNKSFCIRTMLDTSGLVELMGQLLAMTSKENLVYHYKGL